MKNYIQQYLILDVITVNSRFDQNISYGSTVRTSFTVSEVLPRHSTQLGLININVYANFYPDITYGSRVTGKIFTLPKIIKRAKTCVLKNIYRTVANYYSQENIETHF